MRVSRNPKLVSALAFCFVFASFFADFFAQDPQSSPTPSPSPSPTASVTPSPVRTPSPTPLPGAQNFHQWGSITVFNGLPSDSVRAIAQTQDGVMWFGTDNGLARFDGRRVQNLSPGDIQANRVRALKVSPAGDLWIATEAGAFVYSDNRFQPVANTQGIGITTILIGGDIYLGTENGLVLRARHQEGGPLTAGHVFTEAIRGADDNPLPITSLLERRGKLLASTSTRGVFAVDNGALSEFATAPRPLFINSLAVDEHGNLWLGSDAAKGASGIYVAGEETRAAKIAAQTADVLALEANESGIWAGSERYGLFHLVESKLKKSYTFANTSGGLRSDTIYTLFTDREGVLWIGTNRGVSRFDLQGPFQQTVSDIPNSNFIRTLWRTKKTLFAGSNRGLFTHEGDKWNRVAGFENRSVYTIYGNDNGTIVGTSTGTLDERGRMIAVGDTRSIEKFGKTYAAIVGRGVVDISSGKQEIVFPDESACFLRAFNDRLWIGTIGHGLFSFDGKTVKVEVSPEVLKSGAIWSIVPGADQAIWIAGEHGVFRIKEGQVERIIEVEDVRDVFVSGADVWAATTTRGLLHARHDDRFGWLVSAIGFEQGLPSEKAFSISPGDGLLIATNRGVVNYRPATISPKLIPMRVLSQRVHDLGELKSAVTLEYPQNSLLVEVAGQSSRTFHEEFQYAFVLTNSKGDELDKRVSSEAEYAPADLSPGEYTIEAIAFNRDLLASEPIFIRFSVARAPFPWTATALGILLVMSLVALGWAIVEHRRIKHRNRELATARLSLANEAERERRRIARDLHDQTLADLRNLMIASDKLVPDNREFRSEIEAVSTEIRRICEDLNPSVLENVGLVAALEFLLGRTVENSRFSADESVEEKITFPLNVQLQVYRIAQEVLTNIQRHAGASLVEMNVGASPEGTFLLTIRDNGTPFEPDNSINKGRGITNIKTRASLINASVAWTRNEGNNFSLSIKE